MASSDLPNEAISTSMAIFVQVLATEDVAKPHGASMLEVYSALAFSKVSHAKGRIDLNHLSLSAWVIYPNAGTDLPDFSVNNRTIVPYHHVKIGFVCLK
jgi:hypothetical protein